MNRTITLLFVLLLGSVAWAQNSALKFDGQEEYLSLTHNTAYNIGTGFTIEAWILATEWRQAQWQGSIAAKDNQGPDRGFSFRCGNNGILSFVMSVGNVWQEAFTSPIMNLNQWHHVAAVVDNGTILLYVDGQAAASQTFSGSPSHSTDMEINIGGSPGFGGRNFNGVIDELRIWDVARSQQELLDNSTLDLTGNETGLVGYFPMNEGTGLTAGDASATQNNASLNLMDNSNWVSGYTLPDFDVAVKEIQGIDVVNMVDRPVGLTAVLQNNGTQPIAGIDLTVSIDGTPYHTEAISATIQPGSTLSYDFVLPLNLIGTTDPEITIEAAQADDTNLLNNTQSLVIKTGTSTKVIVKDQTWHRNGDWTNTNKITLPTDLHKYEQILLNIDLTCPNGGCGPWDVLADLYAITDQGSFELARYITPYGIACGGWVVDITDFKSVLGGEVEFQSNIFVFTAEGWLLDMSIDLIDNNAQDTYTDLSKLWEIGYQVYGDPAISYDLPDIPVTVQNNTTTSHVRMTITGHGQGNTNNAAEFYNVTHQFQIDGNTVDNHNLWKADCASNSCDNQAGTWLFPRAGWCPGQEVTPYIINTTSSLSPGSTAQMDYVLQDYTNLLNTGYNNSSHTEPYYKIFSYFVESSNTPYSSFSNLQTVGGKGYVSAGQLDSVGLTLANTGFDAVGTYDINIFFNKELIATETISASIAAGDFLTQTLVLSTPAAVDLTVSDEIFVEVAAATDENPGDDVIIADLENVSGTNLNELTAEFAFEVFPNPSNDGHFTARYEGYWNQGHMNIYTISGQLIQCVELGNEQTEIQLPQRGMYLYTITQQKGEQSFSGKMMFH